MSNFIESSIKNVGTFVFLFGSMTLIIAIAGFLAKTMSLIFLFGWGLI